MPLDNVLEENKPLAPFTTLGVGGRARWFVEAKTEEEVAETAAWARDRGVRLLVMGGGSNLVVSDTGFDGLVLHMALRGIVVEDAGDDSGQRTFRAGAGEDWDSFVARTIEEDCAGLECLAGIPGTVGGTPVQNVGAYGQEVSSTIERVRAFDLGEMQWVEITAAECAIRVSAQPLQLCRSRQVCRDTSGLPAYAGRPSNVELCGSAAGLCGGGTSVAGRSGRGSTAHPAIEGHAAG